MKKNGNNGITQICEFERRLLARLHILDHAEKLAKQHGDATALSIALIYLELRKKEGEILLQMVRDGLRILVVREEKVRPATSAASA